MTSYQPAVRRLCAVVDVERYSVHRNPAQLDIQHRLDGVLRAGLSGAGVARRRVDGQDRGDGRLLVLPPGLDEARVVPGLLRGILESLRADRIRTAGSAPRMRLRMALGQGVVHVASTGFVGRSVVEICRLIDADPVRTEMRAVPAADLCLVVTDDLYRDVLVQGYGGLPVEGYRQVQVAAPEKDFTATAWLRSMDASALADDLASVLNLAVPAAVLPAVAAVMAQPAADAFATGVPDGEDPTPDPAEPGDDVWEPGDGPDTDEASDVDDLPYPDDASGPDGWT